MIKKQKLISLSDDDRLNQAIKKENSNGWFIKHFEFKNGYYFILLESEVSNE